MAKKVLLITCLVTAGSVVFLLGHNAVTPLQLINTVFLCSLCLVSVGSLLLLMEKGFFDRAIIGCKRFFRSFDRNRQFLDQLEGKDSPDARIPRTFSCTMPVLVSGVILFSLSFVAAFLL